jgi:hypothetical protein
MRSHLPRPRWLVIAELFPSDFTPPQPNLKGSPIPIGRRPRIVNSRNYCAGSSPRAWLGFAAHFGCWE